MPWIKSELNSLWTETKDWRQITAWIDLRAWNLWWKISVCFQNTSKCSLLRFSKTEKKVMLCYNRFFLNWCVCTQLPAAAWSVDARVDIPLKNPSGGCKNTALLMGEAKVWPWVTQTINFLLPNFLLCPDSQGSLVTLWTIYKREKSALFKVAFQMWRTNSPHQPTLFKEQKQDFCFSMGNNLQWKKSHLP